MSLGDNQLSISSCTKTARSTDQQSQKEAAASQNKGRGQLNASLAPNVDPGRRATDADASGVASGKGRHDPGATVQKLFGSISKENCQCSPHQETSCASRLRPITSAMRHKLACAQARWGHQASACRLLRNSGCHLFGSLASIAAASLYPPPLR